MTDTAEPVLSPPELTRDLYCPTCGYNLRGLRQYRCPECGEPFDPAVLTDSKLPWAHRRRIGLLTAYVQTALLAAWRPRRLAEEMHRRQSYRDAQRFRWITILLAWLPQLATAILSRWMPSEVVWLLPAEKPFWDFSPLFLTSGFLILLVVTGVPSYCFHPKRVPVEQQNRAVALSYYACAPLAACPALFMVATIVARFWGHPAAYTMELIVAAIMLLLWWRSLIVLTARGQLGDWRRTVRVAVTIPVLAAVGGFVAYWGPFLTYVFFGYVVLSLSR